MDIKLKNRLGIVLYILAIGHIIYSFYLATSPTIWFDEIYSMLFAFRPAKELIAFTARDVHPPLYYLILRGFLLVANNLWPSLESEFVAKAASIVPYILIMIYAITYIRKKWGLFTSGLFIFSLCFMPEIMQKTVEIRMYSWALLFVTGLGIHFIEIIDNRNEKKSIKIINAFAIFAYSVAAIYTHYFAAMAVFWMYVGAILIIGSEYIKCRSKNLDLAHKALKKVATVIIVGVIAVICYIPWISVVASQVGTVKGEYWISPLSIKAPYSSAMFLLRASFPILAIGTMLALILIAILIYLLYKELCKGKNGDKNSMIVIYLFLVLPFVALTGYALSLAIRPIFIDRYLEPSIGIFWLAISILLGRAVDNSSFQRFAAYLALFALCINAIVDSYDFYSSEAEIRREGQKFNEMLSSINEDTVIVTNSDLMQSIVTYSLNTDRRVFGKGESYNQVADYKTYLYMSELKTLISEMVPGFFVIDDEELVECVKSGKKVLFMTYSDEREDVINALKENLGIDVDFCGTYFYDHYSIDMMSLN